MSVLPNLHRPFVGRDIECKEILDLLSFDSSTVNAVSLVGPFGYGKSELAKYVGHQMQIKGVSVHYVDLRKVNDSVLFHQKVTRYLAAAAGLDPAGSYELPDLAWQLTRPTLLILDNCDMMFSSVENDLFFQELLEGALAYSVWLKLLTTSRRRAPFLNANFEVYFLSNLQTEFAVDFLIQMNVPSDDHQLLVEVCTQLENVPYSLRAVGAELKPPVMHSLLTLVHRLTYYSHIEKLTPHLKHRAESSIYLTYRQIVPQCRKWSYWFITSAPSYSIPMWSDNQFCLNELLKHSMIEPHLPEGGSALVDVSEEDNEDTNYRVPRLVREFYTKTLGKSPIYLALNLNFQTLPSTMIA